MKIVFPAAEFDDAVAAVCHGQATEDQQRALNALLRHNETARDEYILRCELHSRLASDPDLFVSATAADRAAAPEARSWQPTLPARSKSRVRRRGFFWSVALAANVALAAIIAWRVLTRPPAPGVVATSNAIAMLNETANVRWAGSGSHPRSGAPLEPGWLRLETGLAQVVFYSGARVIIEGPAELELVSANRASCIRGKVTAEVPPQARGFRIDTPQGKITDLGTAFGLDVNAGRTEVHVFKGEVTLRAGAALADENLREGAGVVLKTSNDPVSIPANPRVFASLFDLQAKSAAADAQRLDQWRAAGERLNCDPSLLVRFDFRDPTPSHWQLPNLSRQSSATGDATIVGCQWGEGRWRGKRAIEFQNVSDRIRLNVPGESDALTAAAWVRVQGLDRKLNSLFMSDGFAAGSVHWLVRNDGALGVTIVGQGSGNYQIATSPPVLTVDKFGLWLHVAVVVDGRSGRVVHYVNGQPVGETALRIKPPFRVGTAELGNWNAEGFPKNDPLMIRNFSGAMDEFCLFARAFDAREINALYAEGRPDGDIVASRD